MMRLSVLAVAAFAAATVLSPSPAFPSPVAAIVAVVLGATCLGLAAFHRLQDVGADERRSRLVLVAVIIAFGILSLIGPIRPVLASPPTGTYIASGLTWLGLAIAWFTFGGELLVRRLLFVAVLLTSVILGAVHIAFVAEVGFDVYWLHEAAADAISRGFSPYSDAVSVFNGAPAGPPLIVGYPYPPLAAFLYSLGSWTFGDARWTSLIAWLVVLAILGSKSWRMGADDKPVGIMLMMGAFPTWPFVLGAASTEPLTLALLAIAVATWAYPVRAGGFFGLFLGSKQYLVAAVPVLLFNRIHDRWVRVGAAAVGGVVALIPIIFLGVSDFIDAAVRFHIDAPVRPDGTSVVGLLWAFGIAWEPPIWLMALAVALVVVVFARIVHDAASLLALLGLTLTLAILLSSQAFENYWYLIAGIAALAAVTRTSSATTAGALQRSTQTVSNRAVE